MADVILIAVYRREPAGWALPQEYVRQIIDAAGDRFDVCQARSESGVERRIAEAEVVFGGRVTPENFPRARRLRWVQLTYAGVERTLFPALVESPVVVTNARGVSAVPIAEHLLAMMLSLSRRLPFFMRRQAKRDWRARPQPGEPDEVYEKTLAIIGIGAIGEALAARAKALGMRVVGVKNRPAGYAGAADEVVGPGELARVCREADFVVDLLPATPETAGIISAWVIAGMKPTAFFLNCGRGATVDEEALTRALSEGKIAGAGLDVFAREPLPRNSRLWRMENVIITPHVAGGTPRHWERATDLFRENLRRYIAGRELINVVDKTRGY